MTSKSEKYAAYLEGDYSVEPPGAMARVGRGVMDIAQGTKQNALSLAETAGMVDGGTAARYTDDVNEEIDLYNKGRGEDPGIDMYRMLGEAAPFLPAAMLGSAAAPFVGAAGKALAPAATTMGRIGQGAAGGAMAGGMNFDPQGAGTLSKAGQVVTGGALGGMAGALLPLIPSAIGAMYRKFFKSADEAAPESMLARELGFVDDAAPTRSQLTRDPSEWYTEHETLAKSPYGAPLGQRYRAQTDRFGRIRDDMGADIGAVSTDKTGAAMASFDDISEQWVDSQKAVTAAYAKARVDAPNTFGTLDNFKRSIDEMVESGESDLSPHIGAARKLLYSRGIDPETGELIPINMEQVENIRKVLVQRTSDSLEPNDRRVLGMMTKAMNRDIDAAGDVFKTARKEASDRFRKFKNPLIKAIRDGKANETTFVNKLIGTGRVDDLLKVKELHQNGENPQVWNELKGAVMNHLMDKGFQGRATTESAQFSGVMLHKAINRIGDIKLNIIFDPEELQVLKAMAEVGEMLKTVPEGANINFSNTASTNLRALLGKAGKNPSNLVSEIAGGIGRANADKNAQQAVGAALEGMPTPDFGAQAAQRSANMGATALGAGAAAGGVGQMIPDPVDDVMQGIGMGK